MVKHPVEEHIKKILSPAYVDMLRKQTYETSEGRQKLGYAKHKIQKINTALKNPVSKKMLLKKYPSIESKAKQVRKMIAGIQYSKKGGSVNELKKLEKELDMIMRKVRDPRIRNRLPRFKELRRKIRRLREIHEMDLDDRKKMRRGGMVDDDDIESIDLDMDDLDDMDMELDTDMFEGEDGYITDEETINPSRTKISPETRREYFIDDQLGEDFVFDEDLFDDQLGEDFVFDEDIFGGAIGMEELDQPEATPTEHAILNELEDEEKDVKDRIIRLRRRLRGFPPDPVFLQQQLQDAETTLRSIKNRIKEVIKKQRARHRMDPEFNIGKKRRTLGSGLNQVRENNLFGLESIQLGRRTRSL